MEKWHELSQTVPLIVLFVAFLVVCAWAYPQAYFTSIYWLMIVAIFIALCGGVANHMLWERATRYHLMNQKQALELRLTKLTELARVGIINADQEGIILGINEAAQRQFGYREAEIVGKPVSILLAEEYRTQHDEVIRHIAENGSEPLMHEKTMRVCGLRSDGSEFEMDLSIIYWKGATKHYYTAITQDVGSLALEASDASKMERPPRRGIFR